MFRNGNIRDYLRRVITSTDTTQPSTTDAFKKDAVDLTTVLDLPARTDAVRGGSHQDSPRVQSSPTSSPSSSTSAWTTPPTEQSSRMSNEANDLDTTTVKTPDPNIRSKRSIGQVNSQDKSADTKSTTTRTAVNVSFDTTSSLTTMPPSSQISRSSSRRKLHRGVPIVTNSSPDHTPIETSSDSDDDLMDIDDILLHGTRRSEPPIRPSPPRAVRPRLGSQRHMSSPDRPRKKIKFASILRDRQREAELDSRLKSLEDSVMQMDREDVDLESADGPQPDVDDSIAMAVGDDEDARFRLKSALKRVNAFDRDITFNVFDAQAQTKTQVPAFPMHQDHDPAWLQMLHDTSNLQSPLLSSLVARHGLPLEVQIWLRDRILVTDDSSIGHAYADLLEPTTFCHEILDATSLHTIMCGMSVRRDIANVAFKTEALDAGRAARATDVQTSRLEMFACLITALAASLDDHVRNTCAYLCSLALIDDTVRYDLVLKAKLEATLTKLFESIDDDDREAMIVNVSCMILASLRHDPLLMCLFLEGTVSSATEICTYRRCVALAYFTESAAAPPSRLQSLENWSTILTRLGNDKRYTVHERTDYRQLAARVSILDIAVGAGFIDHASLASQIRKRHETRAVTEPDVTRQFDRQVDALIGALKRMASNIRDGGTSNMSRTECKNAIDRLVVRLEFSLRTRRRPRANVFGSARKGDRAVLERFVTKTGLES